MAATKVVLAGFPEGDGFKLVGYDADGILGRGEVFSVLVVDPSRVVGYVTVAAAENLLNWAHRCQDMARVRKEEERIEKLIAEGPWAP